MKTRMFPLLIGAALPLAAACGDATTEPSSAAEPAGAAAAAVPQAGGGPEYRSHMHGDHASGSSYDYETGTYMYASVWRDGRGGRDVASLYYTVDRCYDTGEGWWTCEWLGAGWGTIPANQLQGNGRSRLTLRTDTRELPDFQVWIGERGPIELEWTKTGHFGGRNSGSWEDRWFNTLYRSAGTNSFTSATFSGRIGDLEVLTEPGGWPQGSMGTANNVTLVFTRAQPGS